ncbi:MAG: TonB-dependent receptor [Bacteroidales bacterium]
MKMIFIILFFLPAFIYSQETIKGKVYEQTGDTVLFMNGVNVYWAGTTHGTTTGQAGEFSIQKDTNTHLLVLRFVGYKADTIDVRGAPNPMRVVLHTRSELGEVVVEARSSGTHISRTDPLNTQKITGEELCRAACCNLSESFTTNASVDVSYSDAVSGAKQIRMLGLSGKYVQLQTENYPNFYGLANSFGLEYVPGIWMESISVSKGSASVLNGYQGITGQINVEYKKPQNSEKLFLNLYGDKDQRYELNINTSFHLNESLSGMLFAHAAYNDHKIDNNNDGFIDLPLLQRYNVFNRWNYEPEGNYIFQAGVKYFAEDRKGGQMDYRHELKPQQQNSYGINIETNRLEGFMKHGYMLNKERETSIGWITSASVHEQRSSFGHTSYNGEQKSIYSTLIFSSSIGSAPHDHQQQPALDQQESGRAQEEHQKDEHNSHNETHSHDGSCEHEEDEHEDHDDNAPAKQDQGEIHHSYSTGLSWRYDIYDETLDNKALTGIENVPGAFFEYKLEIGEKLTAMSGFRADYHNNHQWLYTPRGHIKYKLFPSTDLRLSAGKGYRTARVLAENNVLLASSRNIIIPDKLKTEEAWNYGISWTQYIDLFNEEMTLTADYFRTDFINQVIVDMDSHVHEISFYNLKGESFANNYQLQIDYEPFRNLDLTLGFRYTDVKATYGDQLMKQPLSSDYKGLVAFSYATGSSDWQFDLSSQFNGGGRIPSTKELPARRQRNDSFDPYTIVNLQITKFLGAFEIYGGVENIGDFVQKDPVIAADKPFGENFDASLVWGPIHGRKVYLGARFALDH